MQRAIGAEGARRADRLAVHRRHLGDGGVVARVHRRRDRPGDAVDLRQIGPEAVDVGEEHIRPADEGRAADGRAEAFPDECHRLRRRDGLVAGEGEHACDRDLLLAQGRGDLIQRAGVAGDEDRELESGLEGARIERRSRQPLAPAGCVGLDVDA